MRDPSKSRNVTTLLEQSHDLHQRVLRFAFDTLSGFEETALSIASFQAEFSEGYRRLLATRGRALDRYEHIVPVPSDAFRYARVAVHDPSLDTVRFETSGTTTGAPGVHALRTTRTYEQLATEFARRALFSAFSGPWVVVALSPVPQSPHRSSLAFMMELFMRQFDGRPLSVDPQGIEFDARSRSRWLLGPMGVDVAGLRRAARIAQQRHEPFMVLSTSFALVQLLSALRGERISAPRRTIVMHTGGFKGRRVKVKPQSLRKRAAKAFGIHSSRVVGEYGMTELTSQLYECSAGGELEAPPGVFVEPPWLRVTPVNPATLEPCPPGEVGIAQFVDLGNVDSAVSVLTQDLVRQTQGGIELLDRRAGAPARGCSLPVEPLLSLPAS